MGCDCYRIGGPFIAEDPDCPAHGVDGYEKRLAKLEAEMDVNASFYKLTVQQRDAAWQEIERLKAEKFDVIQDALARALKAETERDRLAAAIHEHRKQKADDRCVMDDDLLYEALGDGIKCDRSVGSKEEMLKNCARFIERRCTGGNWPTYAELETKVERLNQALGNAATLLRGLSHCSEANALDKLVEGN